MSTIHLTRPTHSKKRPLQSPPSGSFSHGAAGIFASQDEWEEEPSTATRNTGTEDGKPFRRKRVRNSDYSGRQHDDQRGGSVDQRHKETAHGKRNGPQGTYTNSLRHISDNENHLSPASSIRPYSTNEAPPAAPQDQEDGQDKIFFALYRQYAEGAVGRRL